jgi:hypothetical protein
MRPLLAVLLLPTPLLAQPKAPPPASYPRGEKLIDGYFRLQVKQIADASLADLSTKDAWEKQRPERRRQFLDMMGLWPLPPKTDLKARVTGTVEGDGFVVEKVVFQSRPGLYVTGNLYLPKPLDPKRKYPTILYVCGHGNVVEGGVSYGSKAAYHYHPRWFAKNGYVCLILDTLELGEIPGEHHGTTRRGMWWWQGRGYTPGGVELWNAVRALDYLETRPEVDPRRFGLTGRSGGGATSWWVAAADDRVKAVAPVAGIADLHAHLVEGVAKRFDKGVIPGHCDCMYMVNTHRWDFDQVVALVAPRPLLLGNSDADAIFPVAGYRRIADKVRKVYALYGADEKFQLLETTGPHKDTPELHVGIGRWMNRWLKDDTTAEVTPDLEKTLTPQQLKVLDRVPEGALNDSIHEFFVKPAAADMPTSAAVTKEWWASRKDQLVAALKEQVFAGWAKDPPPLAPTVAADVTHDGVRLRAVDFVSEAGVDLRLFVLTAGPAEKVVLSVLDEPGWETWCRDLGPEFAEALQLEKKPARDEAKFAQNRMAMRSEKVAFAAVAPRGVGPTKWADAGTPADLHIRRRFALVGQTLDGQRVWDVRRAVAALAAVDDVKAAPVTLHGEKEVAGVALYAGLFEPTVAGFDLWHLPASHRDGPTLLNVLKVLDLPQAVALAAPRPVTLHVKTEADRKAWGWPVRLGAAGGEKTLTVKVVGD